MKIKSVIICANFCQLVGEQNIAKIINGVDVGK
jgi:hypothetical protein